MTKEIKKTFADYHRLNNGDLIVQLITGNIQSIELARCLRDQSNCEKEKKCTFFNNM